MRNVLAAAFVLALSTSAYAQVVGTRQTDCQTIVDPETHNSTTTCGSVSYGPPPPPRPEFEAAPVKGPGTTEQVGVVVPVHAARYHGPITSDLCKPPYHMTARDGCQ
jgi:hypothetical protein